MRAAQLPDHQIRQQPRLNRLIDQSRQTDVIVVASHKQRWHRHLEPFPIEFNVAIPR
jgi:hypothetical protein